MKKLFLIGLVALMGLQQLSARETYNFNSGWQVTADRPTAKKVKTARAVTLPHTWNEDEAFKYPTHETTTGIRWYSKRFDLSALGSRLSSLGSKKIFLEFEGARQAAEVFLNGHRLGLHENGIMAFGFDVTPYLQEGENLIEVRTDNDFNYLEAATGSKFQWQSRSFNVGYGGLTKNVWLHVMDSAVYQTLPLLAGLGTTGTYVYGSHYDVALREATIHVETQVKNETSADVQRSCVVVVEELDGREIARFQGGVVRVPAGGVATLRAEKRVGGLHFWSWGYGYLYKVKTYLTAEAKSSLQDEVVTTTGFRKTEFKDGMIYLNDRVIMMHGYAQRTSNEWPGVGPCVPAWLSDYSNALLIESGGNLVRWMHTCPWKQDVESCDRVGLIQAMPAGDAERDAKGRQWNQRKEVMRDAIVYMRNSPSILFYECGNQKISGQHMREMRQLRNQYDPWGGRAIGCREMLDEPEAEYGGEMLYVNKSDSKPMWMMEYCRDEALRFYWNSWSYPYHQEGDGPQYRGQDASAYNHNQDEFVAELVRRWYDYWLERPGTGTKVNSGGAKIIFSDTQSHGRSADSYRVSGVVDPMRIAKDAFFAHQVMWSGWVDDLKPQTYIVGHWNYNESEKLKVKSEKFATAQAFVVPTIYVVSNGDNVVLRQNGKTIKPTSHDYRFLWTFKNVKYESDRLEAISYDKAGREVSRDVKLTAGAAHHLLLTPIENPTGWKADGNDVALVQVEVVDEQGRRCPLDNSLVKWTVKGPAEYRGGVAKTKPFSIITNGLTRGAGKVEAASKKDTERNPFGIDERIYRNMNHVLQDTLPVECGVNRIMLRSQTKAGRIVVTAQVKGLPKASVTLETQPVTVVGGLATYKPSDGLKPVLTRGETPAAPSFVPSRREVAIIDAVAGSGDPTLSFDTYENTAWESKAHADSAWITYTLAEPARIDEICMKMKDFRSMSYPIAVYADSVEIWRGWTPKGLGFVHIPLTSALASRSLPPTARYTIRMVGRATKGDAFGMIKEMDSRNDEKQSAGVSQLRIIEIEFLKNL